MYTSLNHRFLPYITLTTLMILAALFLWPGIMRVDSTTQLEQAISGIISDAHPPMMAWMWHKLHLIYPGSGLMFIFQFSLLWGSMIMMIRTYHDSPWKWFFVFIPFWPQLFGFSGFILKDIHFAFSFLFVASYLTYATIHHQTPSKLTLFTLCVIMFYGLSVKYQARFILPFLTLWLTYIVCHHTWNRRTLYTAILITLTFYGALYTFNRATIHKEDHWWQYVKIFDLAGINLETKETLFPDYIEEYSGFSYKRLEEHFHSSKVDSIMPLNNPLFPSVSNKAEQDALINSWKKAVLNHPFIYLKHRIRLHSYLLNTPVIKTPENIVSRHDLIPSNILRTLDTIHHSGLLNLISTSTKFKYYAPLLVFYLFLAIVHIQSKQKSISYALPLFFFSTMAFLLEVTLFVFSLGSDARYLYFSVCCLHMCHPFAWKVITERHEENTLEIQTQTC